MLQAPVFSKTFALEYSVHECPKLFGQYFSQIFPEVSWSKLPLIIPSFQPTCHGIDLVGTGPDIEDEKERLLIQFYSWANELIEELAPVDWADFIDPCSGYPVHSRSGSMAYNEVEGCQRLLRYNVSQVGECEVINHPRWGTNCYPGTLVTTAPLERVVEALGRLERSAAVADALERERTEQQTTATLTVPYSFQPVTPQQS
eukprot:TRINITY_DN6914_c0_g1_i1.p1 TRINITY_DN6914_c0_g1~~TRINITY_DN6914_c0_g1_i1.p1  ORF type:complete len:202 (-),score=8.18 TRINITY_DN6914_c0_g1_i1:29-634(-)